MRHAAKARLGFIGTGTITAAIIEGLAASDTEPILVSPRSAETAANLAARFEHVEIGTSNQDVVDNSETVVLAVRPQIVEAVLQDLDFRPDQPVISLVATVTLEQLRGWMPLAGRLVRAVPLPPVAYRRGPTAIFPPDAEASELFDRLGNAVEIEEEAEFDVFTAATATMASYFAFARSISGWMESKGVEAIRAGAFVAQMHDGLVKAAMAHPERPLEALVGEYQTRGGINEQLLRRITGDGCFSGIDRGLEGILERLRGHGHAPT